MLLCLGCNSGFYVYQARSCLQCMANCLSCNSTACFKCNVGYYYNQTSSTCVQCPQLGCMSCNNTVCTQCVLGTFLSPVTSTC
jgi:hypothetical protein